MELSVRRIVSFPEPLFQAGQSVQEHHRKHNDANDLLYRNGELRWFMGKRIQNPNTHGTGCTLSSAIASNLAKGMAMDLAVERAKVYLSGALEAQLDLGKGSGPMNHGFAIRGEY